jgi:hypothetical protein
MYSSYSTWGLNENAADDDPTSRIIKSETWRVARARHDRERLYPQSRGAGISSSPNHGAQRAISPEREARMGTTVTPVDKKPVPAPEAERTWRERPVSVRWLFRAQDEAGRRGWFLRFEGTGLYARRVGPFPTRMDALDCVETLLAEITLGALLDLHNDMTSEQACVTEAIPSLTGRTNGRWPMNFKQFRQPANRHSRTAKVGGHMVGGRGFRLMSKIGQHAISLNRLEQLLAHAKRKGQWAVTIGDFLLIYERNHVAFLKNRLGTSRRLQRYVGQLAHIPLADLTKMQVLVLFNAIG